VSKDRDIYGMTADGQWWQQLVGIFLCISFAVVMGSLTGLVLQLLAPAYGLDEKVAHDSEFHDKTWWTVAADYGRSLYSELAVLMPDEEAGDRLPGPEQALQILKSKESRQRINKAVGDWSSHGGRRKEMDFWTESRHGGRLQSSSSHHSSTSNAPPKDSLQTVDEKDTPPPTPSNTKNQNSSQVSITVA